MTAPPARLQRLEQALQDQGKPWRLAPVVEALQALRGGPCTVAVTTGAALGDLTRVDHPSQRMRYLGFTPSAYAPGERRRQGGSTKAVWIHFTGFGRSLACASSHGPPPGDGAGHAASPHADSATRS